MIKWIEQSNNQTISRYIQSYWFLDKRETHSYDRPKLNPEPSAHLIIAPEQQLYNYTVVDNLYSGSGSHWLYPYTKTVELDHSSPLAAIGVKFAPGALYSLKNRPIQPIIDDIQQFDLTDLLVKSNMNIPNLIYLATADIPACISQLDLIFTPWISECTEDKHSKLVRAALPLLQSHRITELGENLHCTQRTLERSFSRVTGYTLKQCQSMQRLESILQYLYQKQPSEIDWVEIAYQFGFSDQPHLIRYIKSQIGSTPKNYAQQRDLAIDIYGGVEML